MASALPLEVRDATEADLPAIVALLADDMLGAGRETGSVDAVSLAAFRAIQAEPKCRELVALADGAIVGCFQVNLIPGLGRNGSWRAQIESVRVARAQRNAGIGVAMMRWAIEEARRRGCAMVQITTDKRRDDAHRFYRRLGFVATHEGMKLEL
jgi:ribosomal protein S18 acetylase RimI-like enzyme